MPFFDTDILLYSISTNPLETAKRERALQLLNAGGALSVQVLREFYSQATRPSRRDRIPHSVAVDLVDGWGRFAVHDITLATLGAALEITAPRRFSYWAARSVAATRAHGGRELYTEDTSHGREVEGVLIVNPFR